MLSNLERLIFSVVILFLILATNEKTVNPIRLNSASALAASQPEDSQSLKANNKKCESAATTKTKKTTH